VSGLATFDWGVAVNTPFFEHPSGGGELKILIFHRKKALSGQSCVVG